MKGPLANKSSHILGVSLNYIDKFKEILTSSSCSNVIYWTKNCLKEALTCCWTPLSFHLSRASSVWLSTRHLKPPHPLIRTLVGDCGDFHLIYTSFWLPGRRGIRLKSRSSINETTSTLKIFWHTHWALRSFCKLFTGRSKINLFVSWLPTVSFNQCVTLGNAKWEYYMLNSRGEGTRHSLLSPGTEDFTHFHLHKKWIPRSSPHQGECRVVSNDWCIIIDPWSRSTIRHHHMVIIPGYAMHQRLFLFFFFCITMVFFRPWLEL